MADLVTAYVDGSFNPEIGKYAYGCIILREGCEEIKMSGAGDNPEGVAQRNVTGEMLGAMSAVQWCAKNKYTDLLICYDYAGIEMWATGKWRAKNNLTQKYRDYMQDHMSYMNISFKKIAAHTGDKYNEEADKLAKSALQ